MNKSNIKPLGTYLAENLHKWIVDQLTINESINNRDINNAINKVSGFLKKRGIYTLSTVEQATVEGDAVYMVYAFNQNNKGCAFVWKRGESTSLDSVMFTSDFDACYTSVAYEESAKWDCYVQLKGASIVRVIQMVADVMSGRIQMTTSSLNKAIRDAQIWESSGGTQDMITESDDPIIKDLEKKKMATYMKLRSWKKKGNKSDSEIAELEAELENIKDQLNDARISIKGNVAVIPTPNKEVQKIESRFAEEERALPEERFDDMSSYILNVILGLDTFALICGAPGIGKTYRIMQAIKKEGKIRGRDYEVIKGKCTPLKLYTMLHDYQKKGQLLIIDDADSVITDDTSIQLVKAATDSSDERIVAYASSAMPQVPEEMVGLYSDWEQNAKGQWTYPKNFVYEGGLIVISNLSAGQIDTAIRSRALICDLNFTTDEVINIIKDLSPHIMPEVLLPESKDEAINYIRQLAESGGPVEISIRTFTMCAKMFQSDAPRQAIERRIREQLKLKFLRGGRKY